VAQVKSNLKNDNENSNKPPAFIPSSQLLECKKVSNNVATKNKIYPRQMSSLNRDFLSQQSVESHFKMVESGCSEVGSEKSTEESTFTDYKESDGTSNISSSESSIRNVPLMEGDVESSDSAQEFCCEEYDEEEILNNDNEIEITQQNRNETLGETVDNKMRVMCEITMQHNKHLNKTVVKTEGGVNIKQEQGISECFNRQDMAPDLSKVKTENSSLTLGERSDLPLGSQFHNCRVKDENPEYSCMLPVDRINCKIETVAQNRNKQTQRKRKLSQDLFGDSDDDGTFLESEPDHQSYSDNSHLSQNNYTVSLKSGRDVTHSKIYKSKMDKSLLPFRNTSNDCNIQEVTVKSMNKSSRFNVQSTSENFKDMQQELPNSGNAAVKVNRQTVADTVVKHLMPFYNEKRIASRDLFKLLARQLAHHLLEQCSTGKLICNDV
jgi:hypothetical protein